MRAGLVQLCGARARVTPEQLLTEFDVQIRRNLRVDEPGSRVEVEDRVVRTVAATDGWTGVTWSVLDATNADAVIADQINRFCQLGGAGSGSITPMTSRLTCPPG